AADVPVESSKGEWGKGQHEVNFVYAGPMAMADRHTVFKQGTKEIADQHGKAVTFMSKFDAAEVGSSCHIHLSIWKGGRTLFWDPKATSHVSRFTPHAGGTVKRESTSDDPSKYFPHFLGGLMK